MRQSGFTSILIILIVLVAIGGAYYFGAQKSRVFPTSTQSSTPILTGTPTQTVPTIKPTADQTSSWKMHNGKEFLFKYPPTWTVDESFSDYFGGQIININNPTGVVSIEITPLGKPYGLGGPIEPVKTGLSFIFNGEEYAATENVMDNRTAFVDQEVNVNGKKYFILFGSGYPVNDDQKASLTDYQKEKSTILQILSSFKSIK